MNNNIAMALFILRNTHDGDDLGLEDLALVEAAVDNWLNEDGQTQFNTLYADVTNGEYKRPWLHEIEYLTIDQDGYVHWKDNVIEHFSSPWCFTDEGRAEAQDIASRCLILEENGIDVNVTNAVWDWPPEGGD